MVTIWACVALQVADALELIDDPWLAIGAQFVSSAAIGVDALSAGVRKRSDAGPSIVNLAPGGWAVFGAMLWPVAMLAYVFARRRARKGYDDAPVERATPFGLVAIAAVLAIGLFTALAGALTR